MKDNKLSLLILPLMLLIPAATVLAEPSEMTPESVKAVYILKMQAFVKLGDPPHKVEKICYFEKPGVPADQSVGQLMAKYLKDYPRMNPYNASVVWTKAIRDLKGCDFFYIPAEEDSSVENIIKELGNNPTLTFSAAKRFILRGGMVGFYLDENNRVVMEGNLVNMRDRKVNVDAQILEIMKDVRQ
ncbi:MAG: YfiR family protein [Alphaproteobacteria bacterium]|nr:YfiR family protein [Alphaproteobacteria bacterium]